MSNVVTGKNDALFRTIDGIGPQPRLMHPVCHYSGSSYELCLFYEFGIHSAIAFAG